MPRIVRGTRQVEAEQIIAVLQRLRVRVDEVHAPFRRARVRTIERDALAVVPEALADRIGEDDRAESGRERAAAGSGRGDPRDAAVAAHRIVAGRSEPASERLPIPDVEAG